MAGLHRSSTYRFLVNVLDYFDDGIVWNARKTQFLASNENTVDSHSGWIFYTSTKINDVATFVIRVVASNYILHFDFADVINVYKQLFHLERLRNSDECCH